MKRFEKVFRKVLVWVISCCMLLTMTSAGVFAATWGDGDTDEEKKSDVIVDYEPGEINEDFPTDYANPKRINSIEFKEGDLSPFTFYDAQDEIGGNELDAAGKSNLAYSQLKDWSRIATKIFSSQSQIGGGGGLSGVTWDGPMWNWPSWFEDANSNVGSINLPDWLCREERKKQSFNAGDLVMTQVALASGFQSATSLDMVRNLMIQDVATMTNHDKKYFENQRKVDGGTLNIMKEDNTQRDVYYTYAMHMVDSVLGLDTKYYNAYGIAFYDFEYVPIEAHGLRYAGQKESMEPMDPDHPDPESWTTYANNTQKFDVLMDVNTEDSTSQVQSNSLTKSSSYNFGGEFGGSFTLGKNDWPIGGNIGGKGDFHEALETTKTEGSEVTQGSSNSSTLKDVPVPAQSGVAIKNKKVNRLDHISYDCPVSIRYKVAIFSISGSIDVFTKVSSPGDFYAEFGATGSAGANKDANTNLYERTQKQGHSTDSQLARTKGYYKDDLKMWYVDWTHKAFNEEVKLGNESESVKAVMAKRSTRLPMAQPGMRLQMKETIVEQTLGELTPMYSLTQFVLDDGLRQEYSMTINHTYPIDGLCVVAQNKNNVAFSGFDPRTDQNKGYWSVAETGPNGEALDTETIKLIEDPVTGLQKVAAQKMGNGYLIWQLNEEDSEGVPIKFTSADGITVSAKENTPSYPYVKIVVHDPIHTPASIAFAPDGEEDPFGVVEESVSLPQVMPVEVKNSDEMVIDHSGEYSFNDMSVTDEIAEIDDNGNLIAHRAGRYEIKASYTYEDEDGMSQTIRTEDTRTITIGDTRKLTLQSGGGMGYVGPQEDGVFALDGCVIFMDQYGEYWKGNTPDLTYTLVKSERYGTDMDEIAKVAAIEGSDLRINAATIEDGDAYTIRAEAENAAGVEPVEFDYSITPYPMVEVPRAVEGLVFNNNTQTGVNSGEGYTLKGEKAVNAGRYEAKATLDSHYKYWADGSSVRTRTVPYEIAPADVEIPVAKDLTYNGTAQVGVVATDGCYVEENSATNAGNYTATAKLQSKNNYCWPDGSTDDQEINWSIATKSVKPALSLSTTTYTYAPGIVRTPTVTAKDGSMVLSKDRDYTVSYPSGRTNAGKYTITVTLKGNYTGKNTATFTIKKATNPMKLKVKSPTVKYKSVKKKNQTIKRSGALTVSKAQGKVTYAKSSGNKKITVAKSSGNITVKKGLKKGTYKVKVKVTAAGNKNYNKITKTVTLKIRVK